MPAPFIAVTSSEIEVHVSIPGHWERHPSTSLRTSVPNAYLQAIHQAGGIPVLLPVTPFSLTEDILEPFSGLLLTGGPHIDPQLYRQARHPEVHLTFQEADRFELLLLNMAEQQNLPVFGVCRGMQMMNIHRGGSIHQWIGELPDLHPLHYEINRVETHPVHCRQGTLAATLFGTNPAVNSAHFQAIDLLGTDLVATAQSDDGIIEAIEDPHRDFFLGVQWHIEDAEAGSEARGIAFEQFVETARNRTS